MVWCRIRNDLIMDNHATNRNMLALIADCDVGLTPDVRFAKNDK